LTATAIRFAASALDSKRLLEMAQWSNFEGYKKVLRALTLPKIANDLLAAKNLGVKIWLGKFSRTTR
jgi:hypothetical protein